MLLPPLLLPFRKDRAPRGNSFPPVSLHSRRGKKIPVPLVRVDAQFFPVHDLDMRNRSGTGGRPDERPIRCNPQCCLRELQNTETP